MIFIARQKFVDSKRSLLFVCGFSFSFFSIFEAQIAVSCDWLSSTLQFGQNSWLIIVEQQRNGKSCKTGWCNVIRGERQLSACCPMSLGETYCLESEVALAQAAVRVCAALEFTEQSQIAQRQQASPRRSDILSFPTRWRKKKKKTGENMLQIICMLASLGNEEAQRSSMKTICNWVGSSTSEVVVKNWENSCGEMFLEDMCWHLSVGCSQVRRLLQGGWIPPHSDSAVCKELFSSPGIICGSVWWDINSFWRGGEKWEHLKGLICHSLSWEGKKKCITTEVTDLEAPGRRVIVHHFHAHVRDAAGRGESRHALYLPLFQTGARL